MRCLRDNGGWSNPHEKACAPMEVLRCVPFIYICKQYSRGSLNGRSTRLIGIMDLLDKRLTWRRRCTAKFIATVSASCSFFIQLSQEENNQYRTISFNISQEYNTKYGTIFSDFAAAKFLYLLGRLFNPVCNCWRNEYWPMTIWVVFEYLYPFEDWISSTVCLVWFNVPLR